MHFNKYDKFFKCLSFEKLISNRFLSGKIFTNKNPYKKIEYFFNMIFP